MASFHMSVYMLEGFTKNELHLLIVCLLKEVQLKPGAK